MVTLTGTIDTFKGNTSPYSLFIDPIGEGLLTIGGQMRSITLSTTPGSGPLYSYLFVNPPGSNYNAVVVIPRAAGSASTLSVIGISPSVTNGSSQTVTVVALDGSGNVATGYTGTVHFTSSDGSAELPADATLTNGVGHFPITFLTPGIQSVTATDTVNANLTGEEDQITVSLAKPIVTGISPAAGPTGGGTVVTITGTGLTGTSSVSFGGVSATSFTVVNDTTITATSPAGSAGPVDIEITTPGGVSSLSNADKFAYLSTPAITSINPGAGPTAGGTKVTITGTHFTGATEVDFAGVAATNVIVVNDTTITVISPAGVAGNADITVVTPGGTSAVSPADRFLYAAPSLSINPTSLNLGTTSAGTAGSLHSFTISGTNCYSDITITAPAGVQISDDGGSNWRSSLTESPTAGSLPSTTILVEINSTVAGSVSGDIAIATSGLSPQDITLSGTVTPASATHLSVTGLANAAAGTTGSITVKALDAYGNVATAYAGTVHFTSSDGQAVLPANSVLTNGIQTFSVTLKTVGSQTVTATDTTTGSITGSESGVTVTPASATHLSVTGLANAAAGTAGSITVKALDAYGNVATAYAGTVHFTSSDGQAVLPANSVLTEGVQTFNVTLKTAGSQSVTATDTTTGSINGSEFAVSVTPASAIHLSVTGPAGSPAGTTSSITVKALDAYGNVATAYAGTVHFTSSDGQAVLPANSVLTNGIQTFSVTLKTVGSQTVTATDTTTGSINGSESGVTVTPASATSFSVTGLSGNTAGTAGSMTVTALDSYGNVATSYSGTVHFTSSDAQAVLPANASLNGGTGTFDVTLKTAGTQLVTATDSVNGSITGSETGVFITAAATAQFQLTGLVGGQAGLAGTVTIRAVDAYGNLTTGYSGTLHFTSSDPIAILPANATLNNGVGRFTITFKSVGSQSVTVTDTGNGSLAGSQTGVSVTPAPAASFSIVGFSGVVAGTDQSITIQALDAYRNVATSYSGMMHFTSSDGQAVLPQTPPSPTERGHSASRWKPPATNRSRSRISPMPPSPGPLRGPRSHPLPLPIWYSPASLTAWREPRARSQSRHWTLTAMSLSSTRARSTSPAVIRSPTCRPTPLSPTAWARSASP